jgi:uncharacterized protein (DUF1499 family)
MKRMLALAAAIIFIVLVAGYVLLERHPGYGAYYGIAKLTGARLDIGPVNFQTLRRRTSPNDALVCPRERCPNANPDRETKIYSMSAPKLLARVRKVALAEPRTGELYCGTDCDRIARFVQYSRLMRYPDTIDVEVFPIDGERSALAIYSRSLVGYGDFGVNRDRIERWISGLN